MCGKVGTRTRSDPILLLRSMGLAWGQGVVTASSHTSHDSGRVEG